MSISQNEQSPSNNPDRLLNRASASCTAACNHTQANTFPDGASRWLRPYLCTLNWIGCLTKQRISQHQIVR